MSRSVFFVFVCFLQYVYGFNQCASNKTELSCTTEILGENSTNYDYCKMKVYPPNSQECGAMKFKSVSDNVNWNIGGVTLKPHIVRLVHYDNVIPFEVNHTVLNISFTNIKWKTMKFRFQDKYRNTKNHCRNIMISNDFTVDDQSVLYYDCYWPKTDDKEGQSHMLDFEATAEDKSVNRGQYYFNIPSAEMLSPTTTEERWKPFIYVEILEGRLRVHIMPPPCQLKITAYRFKVITTCGKEAPCSVKTTTLMLKHADEVTYDYNYVGFNGNVTFVVIPLHASCKEDNEPGCQAVKSPIIKISSDQMLNICIASITALIVATLFAYYIVLRVIRRYCCQERSPERGRDAKIPRSPTVLVIYPTHNRAHVDCVGALAYYLRHELGFDVLHDGDIAMTIHGDPYTWALEAFRQAEVVMYVVGPAVADTNINIYDKPINNAHKNIDTLLLSFLKANRASRHPKDVITVYFEHSNGPVPPETQPTVASFKILKDCNKLVAYLSRNMIPRVPMMLTPRGRFFVEELKKAGKVFGAKDEILVQYDNATSAEKRILL